MRRPHGSGSIRQARGRPTPAGHGPDELSAASLSPLARALIQVRLTTRHASRVIQEHLADLLLVVAHTRLTIWTDQYLRRR